MSRILLDTNVVLRWLERGAPEHAVVVEAIRRLTSRGTQLVLAPQVLIEFWVVATRPVEVNGFGWDPRTVGAAVEDLKARFDMLAEGPGLFDRWLSLVQDNGVRGKSAHDARLAAIAIEHHVPSILTLNDGDFARFAGLSAVHPSTVK